MVEMMDLMQIDPELRDSHPRPNRWIFTEPVKEDRRKRIFYLLQQGIATRAHILKCEWYDDGRTDEIGPSIRALYMYEDRYHRQYTKTFQRSFDGWHLALNSSGYGSLIERTWFTGGHVTILYESSNPMNSIIYSELPIQMINPPPPKEICQCCGHRTLEAGEFLECPECGHHTIWQPNDGGSCHVCGWHVNGGNPVTLDQAKRNYRLFGNMDESTIYWHQVYPYPEEISGYRYVPPKIWLVNLPDTYWDAIWQSLLPLHIQLQQGWQLLIAQHPNYDGRFPQTWWDQYTPKESGYIAWRQLFEEAHSVLNISEKEIKDLSDALLSERTVRIFLLDHTKLKYSPYADWSFWCLLTDGANNTEYRFGKAKQV